MPTPESLLHFFGISIFLSENGALENVSFSALFIDFTREKICAGL